MSAYGRKMSVASRTNFVHLDPMKEDALVQFKLMLPAGLKARVEVAAAENRRSLSQEIVATLDEKYPAPQEYELTEIRPHSEKPEGSSSSERPLIFYEEWPGAAEGFVRNMLEVGYQARIVTIDGKRYIEMPIPRPKG